MFDKDLFIHHCVKAAEKGQGAVLKVVSETMSNSSRIVLALGEPESADITPLYRSPDLTILNFVWTPCMSFLAHNHQMYAVIGEYSGREDNVCWQKTETSIEAAGAKSLVLEMLPHSVLILFILYLIPLG